MSSTLEVKTFPLAIATVGYVALRSILFHDGDILMRGGGRFNCGQEIDPERSLDRVRNVVGCKCAPLALGDCL